MATRDEPLGATDAVKTYRYLRIGMVGAVLLLGTSILLERRDVDCWQTSISAYYYTPVRPIFVGSLMAVGLALIVIKGRTAAEDGFLNAAGMLAPLVAVAPTTDVGRCWSVPPERLPILADGEPAPWVVATIDNNVPALLIAGAVGLVVAFVATAAWNRDPMAPVRSVERRTVLGLAGAAGGVAVVGAAYLWWDGFATQAHGLAALLMFVALIAAVVSRALADRRQGEAAWARTYGAIAGAMVVGGVLLAVTRVFGEHTVFAVEAYEITLFAVFWLVQTAQLWDERVVSEAQHPSSPAPARGPGPSPGSGG